MLRILYFAWLRDRLGRSGETLDLPQGARSVQDLVDQLRARGGEYGEIFARPELIRVAVNQSFAAISAPIAANDEIAFFPRSRGADPVMPRITIRVQAEVFDSGHETTLLLDGQESVGGVAAFTGIVRGGDGLCALELEHYPGMTESMMQRIAESACARFGLVGCTVIHRVGRLEVGMPIVLVLCAAAHRSAAFDATEFMMDWLKTSAPFWKREEFGNGRSAWVEPRAQDDAATARWGTLES